MGHSANSAAVAASCSLATAGLPSDPEQFVGLDEATEVLTRSGWRRREETVAGVEIAAFDLQTASYNYEPCTRVATGRHSGPVVRIESDGISSLVTPENRAVIQRVQRAKGRYGLYPWCLCPAVNVPCHIHIPKGGRPISGGLMISEDLLRLMGWVLTDGSFHNRHRGPKYLTISQSPTTVKGGQSMVAVLDGLTGRLGCVSRRERVRPPRDIHGTGVAIARVCIEYFLGADLSGRLLAWLGNEIHRIPRLLLDGCSEGQLRSLWTGMVEGDGTMQNGRWYQFYAGKNEGLADDFQELCLALGFSASKRFVPQNGQWTVLVSRRSHHYVRRTTTEHYSGVVWNIALPSGAFVARRAGKAFVVGN